MPGGQGKYTARTVRVPDELWTVARQAADANGETVADVLRRALERYVRRQNARADTTSADTAPVTTQG